MSAVSLLALVLLSTANDTGTQARAAGCLSNLRRLTQAWLMYAVDHRDYFPPNVDDGGRSNWVYGIAGALPDATNVVSLVDGRYSRLGPYSRDPTIYRCPADASTIRAGGQTYTRVRSCAANQAVGTKHDGFSPVDGPWLDGNHSHTANRTWHTYARLSDVVRPAPAQLWVLIDEDEFSINDGGFAVIMPRTEMIDWPATRHDVSAVVSFADGSAEIHRWRDPRTIVHNGNVNRGFQPGNVDILWLQERTTRRVTSN
ncbi:MAG TPA: hypothetical protein VJW76_08475 [Verrucomicrobiae bacterium]|nr:hypothetical protein [Verrucomicrobiae bacterium]